MSAEKRLAGKLAELWLELPPAPASKGVYRPLVILALLCLLIPRFCRAEEKPPREFRAMWNHSGVGAYPGDWERSIELLADNGFNAIIPNMLWGGVAHYASELLPRSNTFKKHGDQIEQCCAAAKKRGVEVHVWKVGYNLSTAPKSFVEKMRKAGRTQVSADGKPSDWLCPSHPDNKKLELETMLEVAGKYPIDGLHFDYIRYPNREQCYCDGCRRRFEAAAGRSIADGDWPKQCRFGAGKDEYNDWRCSQITDLVAAVSREAKKIRPNLKISAAVFGAYPDCRRSVAQDWLEWVKAGHLDFICPMNYTADDAEFAAFVARQMKLIDGRIPMYPGIGAAAAGISMTADQVSGQIRLARSLGAGGFVIFNFNKKTAESIVTAFDTAGIIRVGASVPSRPNLSIRRSSRVGGR